MNYKKVSSLLLSAALLVSFSTPVSAAIRCETQYGGGQVCVRTGNLQVNKQVKECLDPKEGKGGIRECGDRHEWRDNLVHVSTDRYFKSGEIVDYRILVKNVGDALLNDVKFFDTLPKELELIEGSLDQNLGSIEAGQTKEVFIKARVKSKEHLGNMNTNCDVANTARATSGDTSDQDTAKVCVVKGEAPVKQLPKSGPEGLLLTLALSVITTGSGFFLFRKAEQIV